MAAFLFFGPQDSFVSSCAMRSCRELLVLLVRAPPREERIGRGARGASLVSIVIMLYFSLLCVVALGR